MQPVKDGYGSGCASGHGHEFDSDWDDTNGSGFGGGVNGEWSIPVSGNGGGLDIQINSSWDVPFYKIPSGVTEGYGAGCAIGQGPIGENRIFSKKKFNSANW